MSSFARFIRPHVDFKQLGVSVAFGCVVATGCASRVMMVAQPPTARCHTTIVRSAPVPLRVQWIGPDRREDRERLTAWCDTVGPAVISLPPAPAPDPDAAIDSLAVVSWNTHVGGGDLARLVGDLREGRLTGGSPVKHFVLLLQEVFRQGQQVPSLEHRGRKVPHRIAPARATARRDIVEAAERLGLSLYYVPSMRNGDSDIASAREDRGNAILSTLPLADFEAIELPFERQRRVAIAATIVGGSTMKMPWRLRVVNVHLDNLSGPRRLWWMLAPAGRAREVLGLMQGTMHNVPTVVGGDFNTWFGGLEAAHRELRARFGKPIASAGFGPLGLPLDHLFARLPAAWQTGQQEIDERYGSDHRPLVASIRVPPAALARQNP